MKSSFVLTPLILTAVLLYAVCFFGPVYSKEIASVNDKNVITAADVGLENEKRFSNASEAITPVPTNAVLPNTSTNNSVNNNSSLPTVSTLDTTTTSTITTKKDDPTTITTTLKPIISTTENTISTSAIPSTVLPPNPTVAPSPQPSPVPGPVPCHRFDGPSFIGGIVLTLGLLTIGMVAYKFYKNHNERNYQTL